MLNTSAVHKYYDEESLINYFNYLLNGRWHTGLSSHKYGQIQMQELLIKKMGIKSSDRVLDFGCGVGLPTYDIHLMTGCDITGVNISPKQIKLANQLVPRSKSHKIRFIKTNGFSLPFPDNYFDKIVFFESICHVPNKREILNELHRVLKPGGILGGEDWISSNIRDVSDYQTYIKPICDQYRIPMLPDTKWWVSELNRCGFMPMNIKDLRQDYNLESSFKMDYFDSCGLIGLIYYVLQYFLNYIMISIKYPQLILNYPYKPKECSMNPDYIKSSAQVLNDAYITDKFSVGLIIAKKLNIKNKKEIKDI
jgi:ubiquinone/menaquinone biosynthesis C-methylase UbiE